MRLYAILDTKVGYYTPFEEKTDETAKRAFIATARQPETMINKFPEDYALWYMGYYDTQTGKIDQEQNNKPCMIMRGDETK